jgi:hypothetical protein
MTNTLDLLYGRTAGGLMVPRAAMQPVAPEAPALVKMSRQQRRWLERRGFNNRCACGRVISFTAKQCAACAMAAVDLTERAAAAGLVLP